MTKTNIEWVLFDLGGVLVHVDPESSIAAWAGAKERAEKLEKIAFTLPEVKLLETGRISPVEFADQVIVKYDLVVAREVLLDDFKQWIRYEYAGSLKLLENVQKRTGVACLSNTNAVHWARVCEDMSVAAFFDAVFLSHETGFFKPDRRAYEDVVETLQCAAGAIVFLDDKPENVMGAQAAGLRAYQVQGVPEARAILTTLEILDAPG